MSGRQLLDDANQNGAFLAPLHGEAPPAAAILLAIGTAALDHAEIGTGDA